ncbi:hypothetical protein [Aminipila luticellarii]|uniref:Vitamin B12 dependent methionine synthase, activation domain n=1 Tax=Aminipila luticellarii TaxID=2507160 RepID=A0A410PWS3_9FIRM|nr:hypothetical protein [Aminipila luticellarii]QAT43393.1 hypothetical protein EQM06_09295 [Aminipila luticellarii]
MKNQKIQLDEEIVYPLAEQRFIKTCGFDLNREKHQRMMKRGQKVREDGIGGIRIQALVSFYDSEIFKDGRIRAGDAEICCNYFEQIPENAVKGIYFYMLTAGECYFSSEDNIMDFLYADIWGTNYVDAGIEILKGKIEEDMKNRLKGEKPVYLSEEFGPGYFGMPIMESKKFFQILNGEEIGVSVKDSGLLIPQKTCSGLFFVLNDPDIKTEPECMRCLGNPSGCRFCKIRARMEEVQE